MLIVNIGKYNLILGRRFFEDNDILIDYKCKRFIWP